MRNKIKDKKIKKFTVKMQAKLLLVFCVIIIGLIALIGRIIYLNRTDGEKYKKRVLSQQTYNNAVIPYKRGDIVDRKGTILATSQKVYNLILDPVKIMQDKDYLEPTLNALLASFDFITRDSILDTIKERPKSQYVIMKKGLSYDEKMVFMNLASEDKKIQGVWFDEEYVRKYPFNTLGSSILGFTISGNVGSWGIEQQYNEELNGTNGREYGYIDTELKLERTVKPAINGHTIISTIDANVQGIVQSHIKKFNEEIGSKNIGVIVMNSNNGEILAMASNGEYDLNNPTDLSYIYPEEVIKGLNEEERQKALNTMWRNYAISDSYEPGSTFKPFTIALALDEDVVKKTDTFICDGHEIVDGWTISCSKPSGHGTITLMESLMKSCNDALMDVVFKVGKNLFYSYQTFFGFGSKTNVDLPGEASGLLIAEEKIKMSDLATSSFGQTFTVTMIQMATNYSSLVNGGYYYEPHIVKQIINEKGATVKNINKILVKETVTRDTSQFINESMYQTVENGTAKGAKVPGYQVGGKTGTAEKYPRGNKKYVVSFLGAVPALDPEIVIYVVIDEAQNVTRQDDSSLATQFASKILTDILPFLEIFPTEIVDEDIKTTTIPVLPSNSSNENNGDESQSIPSGEENNEESNGEVNEVGNEINSNEVPTSNDNGVTNESENSLDDFNADAIGAIQGELDENDGSAINSGDTTKENTGQDGTR